METRRNNSKKRQALLDILCADKSHPTAETLYRALNPSIPELSLGTVYRNLSVLAEEGLVISVANVDGQERYDGRTEPHAHFVCRVCRRVLDLELPDTVSGMYGEIERRSGCEAESYALNLTGLCRDCRQ